VLAYDRNSEWFKFKTCGSEVKLIFLIHCGLISVIKIIWNIIPKITVKFDRRPERVRVDHTTIY
jgi:hypothetical protein